MKFKENISTNYFSSDKIYTRNVHRTSSNVAFQSTAEKTGNIALHAWVQSSLCLLTSCKSHKRFIIVKIQVGEVGRTIKRTIHLIDLKFWILGTALYFTAKLNLLLSVKCKIKVKVNILKVVFKKSALLHWGRHHKHLPAVFLLVLFENFNSLSQQNLCITWQTSLLLAKHQPSHARIASITRRCISVRDFLTGRYKNLVYKELSC